MRGQYHRNIQVKASTLPRTCQAATSSPSVTYTAFICSCTLKGTTALHCASRRPLLTSSISKLALRTVTVPTSVADGSTYERRAASMASDSDASPALEVVQA